MRDHYKLLKAILWRNAYTSTDFTFSHCHIRFLYDVFLIQNFKNYVVFYSKGYSSHVRYAHIKT
jgi:hypothetical protein